MGVQEIGKAEHRCQRRFQFVRQVANQPRPGVVQGLKLFRLVAQFVDETEVFDRQRRLVGDRGKKMLIMRRKRGAVTFIIDIEDADGPVTPLERQRERRSGRVLTFVANGGKPAIFDDVIQQHRLAAGINMPGHAFTRVDHGIFTNPVRKPVRCPDTQTAIFGRQHQRSDLDIDRLDNQGDNPLKKRLQVRFPGSRFADFPQQHQVGQEPFRLFAVLFCFEIGLVGGEGPLNCSQQFGIGKGFHQVVQGTAAENLANSEKILMPGDDEHRHIRLQVIDQLQNFDARHLRHLQIGENRTDLMLAKQPGNIVAGRCLD